VHNGEINCGENPSCEICGSNPHHGQTPNTPVREPYQKKWNCAERAQTRKSVQQYDLFVWRKQPQCAPCQEAPAKEADQKHTQPNIHKWSKHSCVVSKRTFVEQVGTAGRPGRLSPSRNQNVDMNEREFRPLRLQLLQSTRLRGRAPRASRNTMPGRKLLELRPSSYRGPGKEPHPWRR
jgi:hypothetical protein